MSQAAGRKKKNSKRQKALKTVNTFDGGKCTMLIKISDCLGISDCMEFVTLKSITASKHLKASKLVLRALAQAYSGSVSSQRYHLWCLQKKSEQAHISAFGSPFLTALPAYQSQEQQGNRAFFLFGYLDCCELIPKQAGIYMNLRMGFHNTLTWWQGNRSSAEVVGYFFKIVFNLKMLLC